MTVTHTDPPIKGDMKRCSNETHRVGTGQSLQLEGTWWCAHPSDTLTDLPTCHRNTTSLCSRHLKPPKTKKGPDGEAEFRLHIYIVHGFAGGWRSAAFLCMIDVLKVYVITHEFSAF